MNRNALTIASLLAACLVLAACNQDAQVESTATPAIDALETPPAMSEPEAPAATVRVTDVTLGTDVGDDHSIAEPATSFAADDDDIHVSITTNNDADGETMGTLAVRWTFDDGEGEQLVDERSERFAFSGQDVTSFRITNPDGWPMGSYTLEVSVDDEVVETRQFTIQ
ncbi:hypothetical protein [Luteimonas sp. A478]